MLLLATLKLIKTILDEQMQSAKVHQTRQHVSTKQNDGPMLPSIHASRQRRVMLLPNTI